MSLPDNPPPDIAVIIINWNTRDLLAACLRSLPAGAQGMRVQAVVVDNASADGSAEMVQEQFLEVHLIASATNSGFVGGNNMGYAACDPGARYVLLLNSDAELRPCALRAMVDWLDAHPRAGACGPLTLNSDGTLQPTWGRFPTIGAELRGTPDRRFLGQRRAPKLDVATVRLLPEPMPTGWLGGSCLLVRRAAIDGDLSGVLLDPVFQMYSEETDLCFRLQQQGWGVFFVPGAEVVHHGGRSSRQMPLRTLTLLYQSKTLFFQRHYGSSRTLLLRAALSAAAALKWLVLSLRGSAGAEQRERQHAVLRALWG